MVGLGQSCARMQHAAGPTLEYCQTAGKLHCWSAAACEDLSIGHTSIHFLSMAVLYLHLSNDNSIWAAATPPAGWDEPLRTDGIDERYSS